MKVSGSTSSLMQGVSQQIPTERGPGQHTEQVNMIPDPVQGLSRRHGSRWVAEKALADAPAGWAQLLADTDNYRTFEYSNAGNDYVVLYRSAARAPGSTLPVVLVYNRSTAQFLDTTRNVTDAQLDLLESGGVSGITAIGKYVFLAGHSLVPTAVSVDQMTLGTNQTDAVVWIRGGAYSRKFTVDATKADNTVVHFEYETPAASYPGTLDTSSVPIYALDPAGGTQEDSESAYITADGTLGQAPLTWGMWNPTGFSAKDGTTVMTNVGAGAITAANQFKLDLANNRMLFHAAQIGSTRITMTYTHSKTVTNPNYANVVGDITNAFNSAVTNWIGTAAEAIQPASIAEQLRLAAVAAGLTTATRQGSTIIFDNVTALTVSDEGDGTLIRGVANEVTAIDEVTDVHKVGKVVKVRAKNSAEAFYLIAEAQDGTGTGYTEVTWVEGAGVIHTIDNALCYLTVGGTSAYTASSAALLTTLDGGTHPTYSASTVGNSDSSPLPFFIGKQITYLGVFQDRLIIGAGAVVRCSKTGDYLNFFRSSVLTAPADDPLEMLSQGSEDDVLRFSLMYDRDLVIFGDRRQYAISGRVPLSPTSANMQVMSSHADAAELPPIAIGGVIFYGQRGEKSSALYQMQPGQASESPEAYNQSTQVDTYLSGKIIELASNTKPSHVFARLTGERNSLFVFTYIDKAGQGRVQDAWHKFKYHGDLGVILGMSRTKVGLMVYSLRKAVDAGAVERVYLVADLQPLTTGLATYPYLDSIRPLAQVNGGTQSVHAGTMGDWRVAFDSTSEWRFVGSDLADQVDLLAEFPLATGPQVGVEQESVFVPTNPMIRDRNENAITSGRLTVTTVRVSTANSSGFWADVESHGRETTDSYEYNARVVGSEDDILGRETVTDMIQAQPIALETTDYTLTLRSRTWLPLVVTAIEWIGQWFNRTQRF